MVDPNTIMVFDIDMQTSHEEEQPPNRHPYRRVQLKATFREKHTLHEFDLRQYKTHTRDFEDAFNEAVHKRVKH